jgi:hypothetical protein
MSGFRDHCDDGGPDISVLSRGTHVARKIHICDHCNKLIPVGATYHSTAMLVDGKFDVVRSHDIAAHCAVALDPPDPYEDCVEPARPAAISEAGGGEA